MKYIFPIIVILSLFLGKGRSTSVATDDPFPLKEDLDKAPEFFVLDWKKGTSLEPRKSNLFIEVDSIGKQDVIVLVNKDDEPVLFTSNIATPVCADGECKVMHIRLYWTLLGEYAGFDRYPDLPLTKHDHDEFEVRDYLKLHQLLIDDKSIFGRRSLDRLVEKPTMRNVNGVDALSGATITEVKESVVSGALYSCYTAWHLVHSDIRKQLKAYTLTLLNENILIDMLYSRNADYHLFVLGKIGKTEYEKHYVQIAKVFKTSTPLVRSIIAKDLMIKLQDAPNLQKPIWEAFDNIDIGSRSLLLSHLKDAPTFATDILSSKLGTMSKNQLKVFLEYLSEIGVTSEVQTNIKAFVKSDSEPYAYLVKEFLEVH